MSEDPLRGMRNRKSIRLTTVISMGMTKAFGPQRHMALAMDIRSNMALAMDIRSNMALANDISLIWIILNPKVKTVLTMNIEQNVFISMVMAIVNTKIITETVGSTLRREQSLWQALLKTALHPLHRHRAGPPLALP